MKKISLIAILFLSYSNISFGKYINGFNRHAIFARTDGSNICLYEKRGKMYSTVSYNAIARKDLRIAMQSPGYTKYSLFNMLTFGIVEALARGKKLDSLLSNKVNMTGNDEYKRMLGIISTLPKTTTTCSLKSIFPSSALKGKVSWQFKKNA